jgi:4-hydroxybutyrate CoA-transferase
MRKRRLNLANWQEEYKRKLVSLEEAAGVIKSGDNVFLPNYYRGIMPRAIVARREELRNVTVEVCAPFQDPGWLSPGMEDSFSIIVRIYLEAARIGHDEGRIAFLPYTNGTWFKPYRDHRIGVRDIDVFIMEVSPPDENGFCTFGQVVWDKPNYARRARIVIAEIDDRQIRPRGDTAIHVSEIDYLVDISEPPLEEREIEPMLIRIAPEKEERAREVIAQAHPRMIRYLTTILDSIPSDRLSFFLGGLDPPETAKAMAEHLKSVAQAQGRHPDRRGQAERVHDRSGRLRRTRGHQYFFGDGGPGHGRSGAKGHRHREIRNASSRQGRVQRPDRHASGRDSMG